MTKEELNKLSLSEIENIIDEAIQDAHLQFLNQLTDETSNDEAKKPIFC